MSDNEQTYEQEYEYIYDEGQGDSPPAVTPSLRWIWDDHGPRTHGRRYSFADPELVDPNASEGKPMPEPVGERSSPSSRPPVSQGGGSVTTQTLTNNSISDHLPKTASEVDSGNPKSTPYFVLNTIYYASSDPGEPDSPLTPTSSHSFLPSDFEDPPFKFFTNKSSCEFIEEKVCLASDLKDCSSISSFLSNLENTGWGGAQEEESQLPFSVSILLNRPASLSRRKNNFLSRKVNCREKESTVNFKKAGVLWKTGCWYKKTTEGYTAVKDENEVGQFYRQFKKVKGTTAAKDFLDANEKSNNKDAIPYRQLREHLKNHENTEQFLSTARNHSNLVYLSLIDKDTVDFNGIYREYTQIVATELSSGQKLPPEVMSTGYVFGDTGNLSDGEKKIIRPVILASHLDREVRSAIASYFPQAIYYPEPNMCIRVLYNSFSPVLESFLEDKFGYGLESPAILRKVLAREVKVGEVTLTRPGTWIFTANRNPLITTPPHRGLRTKQSSYTNLLTFSEEAKKPGGKLSAKDIKTLAQVAQSHFDVRKLADSLYFNRGFSFNKGKGRGQGGVKTFQTKLKVHLRPVAARCYKSLLRR